VADEPRHVAACFRCFLDEFEFRREQLLQRIRVDPVRADRPPVPPPAAAEMQQDEIAARCQPVQQLLFLCSEVDRAGRVQAADIQDDVERTVCGPLADIRLYGFDAQVTVFDAFP